MYIPHKQNSIKLELDLIKSKVKFKNFIDKKEIQIILSCSSKTAERRIEKLSLLHMESKLIDLLIEYESGINTKMLASKYNCSEVNINALARRHNIKRPPGFINNIKSDFTFFDNIDSEEKSYILGFFAADGCISKYEFKFAISSKDIDILEKIKKSMKSDVSIRTRPNITKYSKSDVSIFSISSVYLVNTLQNLGFTSNKTLECSFPDIPENLYLHFLRGYFDGDGSFSEYTIKGYKKYSLSICGTEDFLLSIKNILESKYNCKFNTKLSKRFDTENCCYSLNMSGKKNVLHLLNLLYTDSTIFLDRKYNKFNNLLSNKNGN